MMLAIYGGGQMDPLDPQPQDLHLADIAHSLAHQCRYNGHCVRFYSVAEHCVHLVAAMRRDGFPTPVLRWALMHDAPEAWLGDVPRPLKPRLVGYAEIERRGELAVAARFGLTEEIPEDVMRYDARILADEMGQNMRSGAAAMQREPLGVTLRYWDPDEARRHFTTIAGLLGVS